MVAPFSSLLRAQRPYRSRSRCLQFRAHESLRVLRALSSDRAPRPRITVTKIIVAGVEDQASRRRNVDRIITSIVHLSRLFLVYMEAAKLRFNEIPTRNSTLIKQKAQPSNWSYGQNVGNRVCKGTGSDPLAIFYATEL